MKKQLLLINLCVLLQLIAPLPMATSQVPTVDYLGRWLTRTTGVVQQASQFITETAEPLVNTFKNVQGFFQKALTAVNGVITNMKIIEKIIETQEEIRLLYDNSLVVLNGNQDIDQDGEPDFDFLDKWKHTQILLGLTKEATQVFEVFTNVIQEDALHINDNGRIEFLDDTYKGLKRIKAAMKGEIRTVNRQIYKVRKAQQEIATFERLF